MGRVTTVVLGRSAAFGRTLVVAAALASSLLAAPAGASPGEGPQSAVTGSVFTGSLPGTTNGRVRVEVVDRGNGEAHGVSVKLKNIADVCETETHLEPARSWEGRLREDGRFELLYVEQPELSSLHEYIRLIEGRLTATGVRGFAFRAYDPYDPVDGDHNGDECWSDGIVRWTATTKSRRAVARPSEAEPWAKRSNLSRTGTYKGTFGSRGEPVEIRATGSGNTARVTFQGSLVVACDLGYEDRVTPIGLVDVPLGPDGRFRYAAFSQDPLTGDRSFTRVAGRLRSNGRATGYVSSLFDPWDPPGATNEAECMDVFQPWTARRRD